MRSGNFDENAEQAKHNATVQRLWNHVTNSGASSLSSGLLSKYLFMKTRPIEQTQYEETATMITTYCCPSVEDGRVTAIFVEILFGRLSLTGRRSRELKISHWMLLRSGY